MFKNIKYINKKQSVYLVNDDQCSSYIQKCSVLFYNYNITASFWFSGEHLACAILMSIQTSLITEASDFIAMFYLKTNY